MIPLYTSSEFESATTHGQLSLECHQCHRPFQQQKRFILEAWGGKTAVRCKFCSKTCQSLSQVKSITVICEQCSQPKVKVLAEIKNTKHHFCSKSCAAVYRNTHKTHGTRRSKLEKWLEEQLTKLYPGLEIHFNRKDAINSELDIFIPSLRLAFELNGIFHYEPIFGAEKLADIKNNDARKFQACLERRIELCIIDSSKLVYFKPQNAHKFLDIIANVIRTKSVLFGFEPKLPQPK